LEYIKATKNHKINKDKQNLEFSSAQMGAKAIDMALKRAGLKTEDIGMLISATCAPTYSLPANACVIAKEAGINAYAIDITSACSSFVAHMDYLFNRNPESMPDYVMCVLPESWTSTIDYSDRKTAVLIGDGAAAVVVSKKHKSKMFISNTTMTYNTAEWEKVQTKTGEHFYQDGLSVQKCAIKKSMETFNTLQQKMDCALDQHYFISHQANLSMLKSVCKKLKIADEKHLYNVDEFGNCGAAGAPSVFSQNWDKFKSGDFITLVVVGAGLTWGGITIEVGQT